ncbi:M phase inducer phosphatase Cdc25 [Schizosaccharomyces cryophilus OY26]|uniref:M-phase inducer phosphatase n=1 Tax=Schizosaccharomyces cryophilus (strain OY26 / ATCC MYA-4695 / CBS 11777 / NBRC 106824 / NRRL Y48691) TaxID=653667 RepID=S9VNW0_SCHCR|nr:M phase inducer phosphatase Cdc25 [Schizosaccharomyces cryophilus OY26]EPY49663.1 M phase inducer phosphatase Cdc25 [Schizosaccharomyces cryophilus OY26]
MDSPLSSLSLSQSLSNRQRIIRPAARSLRLEPENINPTADLDSFFQKSKPHASLMDPFCKNRSSASPASSLAADFSMNMHIDRSPALPTPRRTLFRSFSCTVDTPPADASATSPLDESPSDAALSPSYLLQHPPKKFTDIVSPNLDSPRPVSIASKFKPKSSMSFSSKLNDSSRSSSRNNSVDLYLRPTATRSRSSTNAPPFLQSRSSSSYSVNKRKPTTAQVNKQLSYAVSRTCSQSSNSTGIFSSCLSDDMDEVDTVSDHEQSYMDDKLDDVMVNQIDTEDEKGIFDVAIQETNHDDDHSLDDLFQASPVKGSPSNISLPFNKFQDIPPTPLAMAANEENDFDEQDTPVLRRTRSLWGYQDTICATPKQPLKDSDEYMSSHMETLSLPCFGVKEDSLKRISQDTLLKLLDGYYKDIYDECIIVDCRFEYEYLGGHITNAINLNSKQAVVDTFFNKPRVHRIALIFHCEHSAHRAPHLALHFRNMDRQMNSHRYPFLYYPEVYILHGGYKAFYENHRSRCDPVNYVPMNDASHVMTCSKAMNNFKRNTTFARTKSYTFGQSLLASPDINDSPTATHSLSNLRRF